MDYFVARRLRQIALVVVVLAAAAWVWHAFFWDVVPLPDVPGIPGLSSRDPADARNPGGGSGATSPGTSPPLYKWKDDQGRWNVTDQPPKDRPFEKVVVDPDTNVIPSIAPPVDDGEKR